MELEAWEEEAEAGRMLLDIEDGYEWTQDNLVNQEYITADALVARVIEMHRSPSKALRQSRTVQDYFPNVMAIKSQPVRSAKERKHRPEGNLKK